MRLLFLMLFAIVSNLFVCSLFSLLTGLVFMLLWNEVVPSVFHGQWMAFYQAWCSMLILSIVSSQFKTELKTNQD